VKRMLVSILPTLFCFAAIAAIVMASSRANPATKSAAFNIEQDKNGQDKNAEDKNVEGAKRFVGAWKGKPPGTPADMAPNVDVDAVFIFKIEGDRLKGTVRSLGINRRNQEAPRIVRDVYLPLPDLNIEGNTLTWKENWILPDYENLSRITLISDDEILYEAVGTARSNTRPTLLMPISYKLKRQK
jgi:hypothetical protein